MNCKEVEERDIPELYLLDRLTESERDEFEKHYFECEPCFAQLQTGLMLQSELRREPFARSRAGGALQRRMWVWSPAFVAVVLLLAVGIWWYSARREPSQRVSAPPIKANPEATAQSLPSSRAAPSLEELARVEAPPYTGIVLRGAEDEAQQTFRKAMLDYSKGDYAHAIPGLRAAVKSSPRTAKSHFYLGVCYLLTDQTDSAIEVFRRTISLGDSSYSEPAHFYLAKAYLRKKDVSAAEEELHATIRLNGSKSVEASEILRRLRE
jgi:TolA-binding protein